MSKRVDPSATPSPEPALPDAFTVPADGDPFAQPSEEQSKVLWADLRELLVSVADRAATVADRETADGILRRLGLAVELNPLFLTATREAKELEAVVEAGEGQAEKAAAALRECRVYQNVVASTTPEEARRIQAERERLQAEYVAASRLAESAVKAASGLRWLRTFFWPLFGDVNPCKEEKDFRGEVRRQSAGILSSCSVLAPKTAAVCREMQIDCYVWDSWRALRRPEPTPARRRFRTQQITPQSGVSALGQSLYSRF